MLKINKTYEGNLSFMLNHKFKVCLKTLSKIKGANALESDVEVGCSLS